MPSFSVPIVFAVGLASLAAYVGFVALKLGLHQRLMLALTSISLELIPDRAAKMHGDEALFTTDEPAGWELRALRSRYPDPRVWSAARIKSYAGYLTTLFRERLGMQYGDRVAIFKRNHLDIQIIATAVVRGGGIACPINGKFAARQLPAYLTNIGARILVTDVDTLRRVMGEGGEFGHIEVVVLAQKRSASGIVPDVGGLEIVWIEEALEEIDSETNAVKRGADEPVYLVHSSGTTGFPKAVILKNGPQSHAVRGWLCYVHAARGIDKAYLAVPNNHQAVILSFHSLLLLGLRTHWIEAYDRDGFDARSVIRELAEGGYTGFFGFPATYTQLKEVDFEQSDLRRMHFWAATADASH